MHTSWCIKKGSECAVRFVYAFGFALVLVPQSGEGYAADKLIGLHSAPAVSQSLPWIAREAGLFKKYNLDFDLVYIQAAAAAAASMIGGDAEIALTGGIAIVRAYLQGVQGFVFIGANKNILTHSIVARPEIKRPQDLKGKRIGVFRFGSNNHYFAMQILPRYGLDPNRDVILRQTGGGIGDVAALINGALDASVMLTYGESAVAQGFHYVIYGPDVRVPYGAAVFVTRQSVLNRRPQVIAQFMHALAEAAKIFHTDLPFTYKVLAKYLRIDDPKILDAAYKYEVKALEPRLEIRPEGLQAILDEVSPADPRAKSVMPQQLIDRRYLDEMDKSGFFDKLWGAKR
jgi:ABC-type nitrate/sulfonate/bicarbonate transport system substrate-binding protein